MPKKVAYYVQKIISSSDGPAMAEKLADDLSKRMLEKRKGKGSVFKRMSKSKRHEELQNLEIAISTIKRQAKESLRDDYDCVIERIHVTGLDSSFVGPIPASIKAQKDIEKIKKDTSTQSSSSGSPDNERSPIEEI